MYSGQDDDMARVTPFFQDLTRDLSFYRIEFLLLGKNKCVLANMIWSKLFGQSSYVLPDFSA